MEIKLITERELPGWGSFLLSVALMLVGFERMSARGGLAQF